MKMSVHALAMETYVPALRTLSELLDKGVEHSKAKGTDAAALLKERLALDMFPLALQVQLACHHAKDGTARATGQEPPKIDTSELPFTELKALIEQTVQSLSTTSAKVFDGAKDRRIELELQGSRVLEADGLQFLWRWSIPHFYFHVVTAYDILRQHRYTTGQARLHKSNHERRQHARRERNSSVAWSDDQRTTVCGLVRTKPETQLLLRLGIYQKRQVSCWASRGPDPWSPLLGGERPATPPAGDSALECNADPPHRWPIALARLGATPLCFRRGAGVRTPRSASRRRHDQRRHFYGPRGNNGEALIPPSPARWSPTDTRAAGNDHRRSV